MSTTTLYRICYLLLHTVYSILNWFCVVCLSLSRRIVTFCHEFGVLENETKLIQSKFAKLEKTPRHVTVLLGKEEPSYSDLGNLVIWCLTAGVSFVSFYDHKGVLNINSSELEYEIDKRKHKEDNVIWHSGPSFSYKNGYLGRKIHVKILSQLEGKLGIVSLSKKLALSENKDFSIEIIDEYLRKQYEFPDPDVGIYFGDSFILNNYPPWQLRVTEFFNVKSLRSITLRDFIAVLIQYNKCEQRLGK